MKVRYIVLSLLFMQVLAACTGDMSPEMIKERIIEANTGLRSYSADISSEMDMATTIDGKQAVIRSVTGQRGLIDRENRRLKVTGSTKTSFSGMTMDMDMETYVIDNVIYIKMMDTWMKMALDADLWTQQDQVGQTIMLLASGSVERLPDEEVGGDPVYVFSIRPDVRMVAELALKEQENSGLGGDLDLGDMIRAYDATIYVNKKTFVIEEQKMDMTMVLTAENMGRNGSDMTDMTLDMSVDVRIFDIDKKVAISLPEEAEDAILYAGQDSSADPLAGNVVAGMIS